ncbi:MAG: hypothetical protein H0T15_04550 [Thermoleophilaceae bacterium]|nr:hypothetical protein [Thermoleophilaceae bacterium]
MSAELEDFARQLEEAAARLRSGEPGPEEAAALVERCAELAAGAGQELEREAREARSESPGQERLL